ncbi:MAG: aldo/keto reductase [Acidobacteria bacterium]|nr:aldo/keto reductase [Acidobacteriota bacterium]
MSFGSPEWQRWTVGERVSRKIVKAALDVGINFFDTADVYSHGASEEILGRALRDFSRRDQVVIATKLMATSIARTGTDLQVAVADWLLTSNVRIRSGRQAGAIAGWLNERGEPEFAYPEITGYYLSWLALAAGLRPEADLRPIAAAAVQWLSTVTSADRPPSTRYYFVDCDDWRNDATFPFDLAMICRGLRAVRRLVPAYPRRDVLQNLLHHALPAGDVLPVFINQRRDLPDRWSTRPGPFQLKTAAALLSFENHPALWNTFYRWSGRVLDAIDDGELHAAFYALEGLVQFGVRGKPEALREAAECFDVLIDRIDGVRSDVVAQALRLGASDQRPVHFNTWAAIFAHQYFVMERKFGDGCLNYLNSTHGLGNEFRQFRQPSPNFQRIAPKTAADNSAAAAWNALKNVTAHPKHEWWGDELSFLNVPHRHLQGGAQVTDAWIAELARTRKGRLATLDSGFAAPHMDVAFLLPS